MARKRLRRAGQRPYLDGDSSVRETLTPKRPREASAVGAGAERLAVALGRRATSGDLQALVALRDLGNTVRIQMRVAARGLNQGHGYSWSEIGREVGITKQAAQERWGGE